MNVRSTANRPAGRRIRVVTYNVHACIDNDGRFEPQRILSVLRSLDADYIGLQEIEDRIFHGERVSDYLARELGMHACRGATLKRQDAHYGNLLLSREPAQTTRLHDISVAGREPRGVIEAEFGAFDRRIRLLVTHFGLRAHERRSQADAVSSIASARNADLDVLLGDFNEWRPAGYTLRVLRSRFDTVHRRRTWPARRPVLALDCICVSPEAVSVKAQVFRSTLARRASDHLPLIGDLHIPDE